MFNITFPKIYINCLKSQVGNFKLKEDFPQTNLIRFIKIGAKK
jgi:hypothetical protein